MRIPHHPLTVHGRNKQRLGWYYSFFLRYCDSSRKHNMDRRSLWTPKRRSSSSSSRNDTVVVRNQDESVVPLSGQLPPQEHRTSVQLYRDCLRLLRHAVGPNPSLPKYQVIQKHLQREFRKPQTTDTASIETAKASAVRALSNYLLLQNAQQDPQLKHKLVQFKQDDEK